MGDEECSHCSDWGAGWPCCYCDTPPNESDPKEMDCE